MTQEEKIMARIRQIKEDGGGLYEIVVYVTPEKSIGFWIVSKTEHKLEGEVKPKVVL